MIKYYDNLHGQYKENNLNKRRETVMSSGSSMIAITEALYISQKAAFIIPFFMITSDSS